MKEMWRKMQVLDEVGEQSGRKSITRMMRKRKPMIRTVLESQLRLLTTRETPAMNANDIVARETPNSGNATLRAVSTNLRSHNCAQMREIATMMELYIAIMSQKMNTWNFLCLSMVAIPWSGSELLYPPGTVKPAAKDTVATRVATNKRVFTLSL